MWPTLQILDRKNDNVKLILIFRYVLFNLIFVLKTRLRVMKSILIESLNV